MTTPNSQCALNALAIDNPIEYARLALTGEMQDWVNAEDNLEVPIKSLEKHKWNIRIVRAKINSEKIELETSYEKSNEI